MVRDGELSARRRLPLARILWGAFSLPWQHRAEVARATGLPLLAVIACTLLWHWSDLDKSGAARWTLYFLYLIATCWLAISIHRLVLLDVADSVTRMDASGLRRLGVFVGAAIGAWLLFAALTILLVSMMMAPFIRYVAAGQAKAPPPQWVPFGTVNVVAVVLALWLVARFCLLFPAIAVDRRVNPIEAWIASRRNGWRLAIVVGVLPWALGSIANLLNRDGASLLEFGLLLVLTALFTVFQVVALSLSYWELTQPSPPPTPPPA